MARIWSRPAWGGWIEIINVSISYHLRKCPVPHGAGGLKFFIAQISTQDTESRPAWGGWIEIAVDRTCIRKGDVSRPAWGGWIEILYLPLALSAYTVPSRMGRVD